MNSAKTEHTAMKVTSVKNKPDLKSSTDSNPVLHSPLATNASNHNSCMVDMLRKNEGNKDSVLSKAKAFYNNGREFLSV